MKASLISSVVKIAACAVLALGFVAQAQDKKNDATGTWTWSTPGRDGGPERKSTLKLKVEGETVTGTVASTGGSGKGKGGGGDSAISEGKIKGDEITFAVVREFNGNKFTMKYKGTISGDEIKGKSEFERDGQAQSRDWVAKREAAK